PTAVQNALEHPGRIVGQDNKLYERNAEGQWIHDRLLLRNQQAGGSLHEALEATYRTRQNTLRPVTTLEAVEVRPSPEQRQEMNPPGPVPAAPTHEPSPEMVPRQPVHESPSVSAPQAAAPTHEWPGYKPPTDLRHSDHPGHYVYQRALEETHRMENSQGIDSGSHSERLAAATVVAMLEQKMPSLSRMVPGERNQIHGIQQNPERRITLDTDAALSKTVEQHSQQWLAARSPHYVSHAPAAQRTREDEETLKRLSPRNQAMFRRAREGAPPPISDATVVQGILAANRQGIDTADKMGSVSMFHDQLLIQGKTPGYRATVDVTESMPSLQESVAQAASLDRQREQERQQERERQLAQQKEQDDPTQGGPKMR
ncbi:MAG: hypothetical protein LBL59_03625, partial [Xanthomonadaceae bacterium]|nr:hypothetical protein [Xanthomonadaceae bacterium]